MAVSEDPASNPIEALNAATGDDYNYVRSWLRAARFFALTPMVEYDETGRHLLMGATCDGREQAQMGASTILVEHMRRTRMRHAVMAEIENRGMVMDRRPHDLREAIAVLRELLDAGFRLISGSRRQIEIQPPSSVLDDEAAWDGASQLMQRFNAVRHRKGAADTITRAVRLLGAHHKPSGIISLEAKSC